MMAAIQFKEYGSPEVLEMIETEIPMIDDHEVLIDVRAIGVNYADTARREGIYVVPTPLPFIPGAEVAGVISKKGSKVENVELGSRVAVLIEHSGYADYVAVAASHVIPLPDEITFEQAVAIPLQGLTAYHTLKTMGRIEAGDTVLVHAAAGGVGSLAVQLAKKFGASKVIATASSAEKLAFAKSMGADELVNYSEADWEEQVRELTDGQGVDIALEMVGGEVFTKTVRCLAEFGRLIVFGAASGEMAEFNPSILMGRNQTVSGFFLPQIMKRPNLLLPSLQEIMTLVGTGELKVTIWDHYPLREAAEVHRILQSRKTNGKIVLIP